LANQVAHVEEIYFEAGTFYEVFSPHESFEAAQQLEKLLKENSFVNG
jgi:hypothetical protein